MDTPLTEIMSTGLCEEVAEEDELSIVASGSLRRRDRPGRR
jgi:hypothetical protein